jgi:hypothetical protein
MGLEPPRLPAPVLVERDGQWVLGWLVNWREIGGGAWEGMTWWVGELGCPGHGWVPAAKLRPDEARRGRYVPALPRSAGRRTR